MILYQQKSPELAYLAFEELYRRYSTKVFSFLLKKCKNQADAEDILQKVFTKIHTSKHLYKDKFKFEQWVFVIARTSLLDHFRSDKSYKNRIEHLKKESLDYDPSDFEVSERLTSLDKDQKEMLEMKYIDELSYQEMSQIFNKSSGSLRKMVSRMVINLKKGEI